MNGDEDRQRLADYVTAARRTHYGTVEQAMRAAGLNRATWLRVEAGERVRDDSLAAVERALGWDANDAWRVMAGGEPLSPDAASPSSGGGRSAGAELRERIESTPMPEATRAAMLTMLDGLLALLDSFRESAGSMRKGA